MAHFTQTSPPRFPTHSRTAAGASVEGRLAETKYVVQRENMLNGSSHYWICDSGLPAVVLACDMKRKCKRMMHRYWSVSIRAPRSFPEACCMEDKKKKNNQTFNWVVIDGFTGRKEHVKGTARSRSGRGNTWHERDSSDSWWKGWEIKHACQICVWLRWCWLSMAG